MNLRHNMFNHYCICFVPLKLPLGHIHIYMLVLGRSTLLMIKVLRSRASGRVTDCLNLQSRA